MPATKAQSVANRRNATKSTGPRTVAGKARSKLNALDHGLRAEQVVLPTEDPAAFAEELAGWFDDWRPTTRAKAALVERAAVGAWRLRRCVRQEAATFQVAAWTAGRGFDDQVNAGVIEGLDLLETDPPRGLAHLRGSAAGLGVLLDLWADVLRDTEVPTRWTDPEAHHGRLLALLGLPIGARASQGGPAALASFLLEMDNDREPGCDPSYHLTPERARAEADTIRAVAREQVADLLAELAGREPTATSRSRHVELRAAEPTERGRSLHRYEMAHDRSFRATLNQLMAMARSGLDEAGTLDEADGPDPSENHDPGSIAPALLAPVPGPIEVASPPVAPVDPPAPNEAIGPMSNYAGNLQMISPTATVDFASSSGCTSGPRPETEPGAQVWSPADPVPAGSPS